MARKTKEESQRTRDRILDAAEHVFMSRGGQHHHGRHRRPRRRVQGAVYGHYKNKIDVCVAMSDRALAAAVALTRVRTDGKALESLYASMLQYVRIYSEEGRCSACWKSCTTSASRATRTRRCCDDGTSGNAMPCAIPKTAARRGAQRRPARRAGRAPVQRLPALPDRGVFGSICWSDRLKGDIWPRVERMLRAAIDTLRFSAPASGAQRPLSGPARAYNPAMTLKQLEAFYWAATCASFAVAAERLHLSVSSLSKRIAELEEALGQLFDRSGHKAALTEAGQRLLPQAGDMLASAERIRASVAQSAGLVGRCRFGVGELTALTWLPRLIGVVRAAHPGLVLEPYVDIGQVLEQRVADGELDFAVIAGRSSRVGIASATIGQAAFSWVAAPAGCKAKPA